MRPTDGTTRSHNALAKARSHNEKASDGLAFLLATGAGMRVCGYAVVPMRRYAENQPSVSVVPACWLR
ncbi:hypothetical protein OJJOAM_002090 [Cupriavidus sp. H18C1]